MITDIITKLDKIQQEIKEIKEKKYLHRLSKDCFVMSAVPKFSDAITMEIRDSVREALKKC